MIYLVIIFRFAVLHEKRKGYVTAMKHLYTISYIWAICNLWIAFVDRISHRGLLFNILFSKGTSYISR